MGYWVLNFMWLKFTVIWRFFRLWALAAGCAPPENMTRCVNNHYDIEGFWKARPTGFTNHAVTDHRPNPPPTPTPPPCLQAWHASFNRWLVRYLYIPLGGSSTRLANVWVVFTFVALWHDPEPRLLSWAWVMALALAPEIGAKWAAGRPAAAGLRAAWWYRHVCGAAAAANITVLMAANLIGFVIGVDGAPPRAPRPATRSAQRSVRQHRGGGAQA